MAPLDDDENASWENMIEEILVQWMRCLHNNLYNINLYASISIKFHYNILRYQHTSQIRAINLLDGWAVARLPSCQPTQGQNVK